MRPRPGLKRSVSLWLPADFDAYVAEMLGDFHPLSDEYASWTRYLNGGLHDLDLDWAGRVASRRS